MSISSDEINLLVQHYLQELGYSHAAFAFGCESKIPLNQIAKRRVQPGALVYLIQKGIMFAQMEAAAEQALEKPSSLFAHQLNILRVNLRQSTDLVDELYAATRRMKVFPGPDEVVSPFYLDYQSALILQAHKTPVLSCTWDKDSKLMATASEAGSIVVWNYEVCPNSTCIVHHSSTFKVNIQGDSENPVEAQDITSLDFSPSDPTLAVGTFSGAIRLFELFQSEKTEECAEINFHQSPIVSLEYSSDGSSLLSAASQGTVAIHRGKGLVAEWNLSNEIREAIWGSENNNIVLIASKNTLFRATEGKEIEVVLTLHDNIEQLISDPNNKYINFAIVDSSGTLTVVDNLGNTQYTSQIHRDCICCASWSTSDTNPYIIVTGGCDNSVKMTNVKAKEIPPVSFEGHISPVYSVVTDKNGKYIASAARDSINIWSIEENRLVISYKATCNVITLQWSPNGRFLTVCLFSGEVAVIDFEQLC